jgi:hypothetical protein
MARKRERYERKGWPESERDMRGRVGRKEREI